MLRGEPTLHSCVHQCTGGQCQDNTTLSKTDNLKQWSHLLIHLDRQQRDVISTPWQYIPNDRNQSAEYKQLQDNDQLHYQSLSNPMQVLPHDILALSDY